MRKRLIDSLCAMFNDVHGNQITPAWLLELHNDSSDDVLLARMQNWRANYPQQYHQHGIYVM